MSKTTERQAAIVTKVLSFPPLEQELVLSLLGPEVWRLHRERKLQTSLLLPLHAPVEEFDTYTWGIHQIFKALPKTKRYATMHQLNGELATGISKISNRVDRVTASTYHWGVNVRDLAEQYGVDPIDTPEARWVAELATFILDCVYQESAHTAGFEPWLQVWFDLCDAAAGVQDG